MVPFKDLVMFALVALGMVMTPGPNMIYLLSRSICQGRLAGIISLGGVVSAFTFHILAAATGLSALFLAVPYAYLGLKLAGAAYLFWLAWDALKPGARSLLEVRALPEDSPRRLFTMGFLTNVLNPKAALLYLSILPQFVHPENGPVFPQFLQLGFTQMFISLLGNLTVVLIAGSLAQWLAARPAWAQAQRYLMGTVLAGLGLRLVFDRSK